LSFRIGIAEGGADGIPLRLDIEQQWRRLPTHTALQVEVVLTLLSCHEGDHYWEPAGVAFRTFRE